MEITKEEEDSWIFRDEDDKFNKGDLVLVKKYSCYDLTNPFGFGNEEMDDIIFTTDIVDELLERDNICLGIIVSKEVTSWEPEAKRWMSMALDKPYRFVQFKVHCFTKTGGSRVKLLDSTSMRMVSKGDIGRGIEESLDNLTKNNKQQ